MAYYVKKGPITGERKTFEKKYFLETMTRGRSRTNWQTPCRIVGGWYTLQFFPKPLSTVGEFQLVLNVSDV